MPWMLVEIDGDPKAVTLIPGPGSDVRRTWTEPGLSHMADTVLRLEDGEAVPPDDHGDEDTPLADPDNSDAAPVGKIVMPADWAGRRYTGG